MLSNLSLSPPNVERSQALEAGLDKARRSLGYHSAYFKETFSDELWQAMEHRDLNQVEFSKKAGVSKQFLTKVFRGGNCTMETIVKLAYALNYKAHIHLTPNDIGCEWIHWIPSARLNYVETVGHWGSYQNVKRSEKEVKYVAVASGS